MDAKELDEILTVLVKHKVVSAKIGENEFNIALSLDDENKDAMSLNTDDFGYVESKKAGF